MNTAFSSLYCTKSRFASVATVRGARRLAPRLRSSPSPLRGPLLARHISTKSTEGFARERINNGTQVKYVLLLSTAATLSWLLYAQQQGAVRLDSDKKYSTHPDPLAPKNGIQDAQNKTPKSLDDLDLPTEKAILTTAPNVPPPITRDYPVLLDVDLTTVSKLEQLTNQYKYEKWTFNNSVPGPFIRARVGDVVNLRITNHDESGMPHNIDCHAFVGPG
ncbi:putative multicopper oxidase, partial [Aspergillus nomiae NRRL 13137]